MSTADILTSPKIDAQTAQALTRLERTPEDTPSLRIAFRASALTLAEDHAPIGQDGKKMEGVTAWDIAGGIYTATVSLNGLRALLDDTRVSSVQAAQPLTPQ